jgi:signal transduction histidine kinase
MSRDNKLRINNRLFFKLYINYSVMLLITAVLICLIFMNLYSKMTEENKISELYDQAKIISERTTEYILSNKQDAYLNEYINTITTVNGWDVWTISNSAARNPMPTVMETGNTYEEILTIPEYAKYRDNVRTAFHRISNHQKIKDDEIYGKNIIILAAPIYGVGREEVVGALIIVEQVEEEKDIVEKSLSRIVLSSGIALGISFIIVIIFATELSLPITRMRSTALELAAGNYNVKTGIKRDDELGDLAKTVDILSEKLLENDIERKKLDQMRFDFFANVSHELRTPITVIRAYTETLSDGVVTEEEKVHQYYNRMLSECKSMERLVGDLLLLSKMQNPDFMIQREPVNLVQVFEDIIRSAGAIAEKKNITIEVKKNSPMVMLLGDYDRLRQMFMIILDNAIKFSEEGKTVYITIVKSDKITVSIKDEGIGMEPEDIPNIFEKFYKSNLRQNASGTGLGLAIAKQIAMKHEGTIDVASTPGVGSEFIFTFPSKEELDC